MVEAEKGGTVGMMMEIISIILGIFLLGAIDYGLGEVNMQYLGNMVDIPSVIIVAALTVPVLFKGGLWKDFCRAWKLLKKDYTCRLSELRRSLDVVEMMEKQVICAGIISMLLTVYHILHRLSDPASLGPNLAVAILTLLYAVIFEMVLLPLQLEAKRRIIDYMEVDTDAESVAASESEEALAREEGRKAEETENTAAADETEHGKTDEGEGGRV